MDSFLVSSIFLLACCALLFIAKRYQKSIIESYIFANQLKTKAEDAYQDKIKNFNLRLKNESDKHHGETLKILNEKEQALKILKHMGEAVLTTDELGRINYLNPIAEVYLGWDKDNILNKNIELIFNIYDEKSQQKIACPFEKCINSERNVKSSNKAKLIRRDKVEYSVDYCMSPMFNKISEIDRHSLSIQRCHRKT